jgi:hypothetical protein
MKYIVFKNGFIMFQNSMPEECAGTIGKPISGGEVEIDHYTSKVVCYGGLPELGILSKRADAEVIRRELGWEENISDGKN